MTEHPSHKKAHDEHRLDETVADSFPASDPPAHSGITDVRSPQDHSPDQRDRSHDKAGGAGRSK
jgi:hypothetical protein